MFARVAAAMTCAVAAINTASAKVIHKLQDAVEPGAGIDGKPRFSDDDQRNSCLDNGIYVDCLMSGPYPSFTYS